MDFDNYSRKLYSDPLTTVSARPSKREIDFDLVFLRNECASIVCARWGYFCRKYREDFPSQSSSRKAVRRKELLLNGEEVRNDTKVMPRYGDGIYPEITSRSTLSCYRMLYGSSRLYLYQASHS